MNKQKKKILTKTIGAFTLTVCLMSGTVFAATTMLKWTGHETTLATQQYIEKSAAELIRLKKALADAIENGGSNETITELERQIVLLNEEVHKANTDTQAVQNKLDWAVQLLKHEGIDLGIE